jgi:hypothetical protein
MMNSVDPGGGGGRQSRYKLPGPEYVAYVLPISQAAHHRHYYVPNLAPVSSSIPSFSTCLLLVFTLCNVQPIVQNVFM